MVQPAIVLEPVALGGKEVLLRKGRLSGRVLDNVANQARQGSGFNPLCHMDYPGKPIYFTGATGLNFEHVFNGVAADKKDSMFTPRKDAVELIGHSESSATLRWPGESSSWGMECSLTYTLAEPDCIDIQFSAVPTQDRFGQGYIAFMWASYMACARDRRIYFYGVDGGREGWVAFGEDTPDGFETGTVACDGVAPLPYEEGSQTLNIVEHPCKKFLKPLYYGLIDGDHDLNTTDDTLAYLMMFDQAGPMRFAMWNFITDASGAPDTHRPAWDWQFVVHEPVLGRKYEYRARVVIRPFASPEAVLALYDEWVAASAPPRIPAVEGTDVGVARSELVCFSGGGFLFGHLVLSPFVRLYEMGGSPVNTTSVSQPSRLEHAF
jgi:hypothetical protein